MILCVAIVGQQNNPLYLQSFAGGDDVLKFHYIVHCSLDVFDEKASILRRTGTNLNDNFLGLLYPAEDYKVYGYMTNTRVKFVLVTSDLELKDLDIKTFFQRFHAAYIDVTSNPFHVPGKRIASPMFRDRVKTIVSSFGQL
ncbi:hypothetical protein SELMODRAFT_119017 [Selaginella moellendorffii]|uniref:Trafficking protein particle complex subunit 2-like protein n=1 Tax=Selaginella moellendorffii TaxID=88036 RepID=D8SK51_SELML|nr:trafficking protein particle complex subunit 2-like protein [Selaginella moellendorffii]XP_002990541.1 trafficking protein particle complex subunit 2-like protein [Selaginella moellendorffii]EFJ08418.1 hypothetical protein SELMODRAFT_185320 [Selaginella moellendorffii]EFJ15165.1 hypothetical protein SELMODRAFT_119017 [Selaginella moellendorffii]|eukprot:XP_002983669.1 trafficking protein particle complex subunit 2-like protein [Selaginella moellendorffii]